MSGSVGKTNGYRTVYYSVTYSLVKPKTLYINLLVSVCPQTIVKTDV